MVTVAEVQVAPVVKVEVVPVVAVQASKPNHTP
jgi:hypothetical protein